MAKLSQLKNSASFHYGWYGKCGESHQAFSLSSESRIIKVYTSYGKIEKFYTRGLADWLNPLTKLESGNAYLIVLEKGEDEVDVPGFSVSEDNEDLPENFRILTKMCDLTGEDSASTPTPPAVSNDPTPTPKLGEDVKTKIKLR